MTKAYPDNYFPFEIKIFTNHRPWGKVVDGREEYQALRNEKEKQEAKIEQK